MQPDEFKRRVGSSRRSGGKFKLLLYLIVGLTVLAILLLFVLFLSNRRGRHEEVDINVVAPTATPQDYNKPVLQPVAPGPTPPKVRKPLGASVLPSPSPTPSPTPAKTPT